MHSGIEGAPILARPVLNPPRIDLEQHFGVLVAEHPRHPGRGFPTFEGVTGEGVPCLVHRAAAKLGCRQRRIPDLLTEVIDIEPSPCSPHKHIILVPFRCAEALPYPQGSVLFPLRFQGVNGRGHQIHVSDTALGFGGGFMPAIAARSNAEGSALSVEVAPFQGRQFIGAGSRVKGHGKIGPPPCGTVF